MLVRQLAKNYSAGTYQHVRVLRETLKKFPHFYIFVRNGEGERSRNWSCHSVPCDQFFLVAGSTCSLVQGLLPWCEDSWKTFKLHQKEQFSVMHRRFVGGTNSCPHVCVSIEIKFSLVLYEWIEKFENGCTGVMDVESSGCPATANITRN